MLKHLKVADAVDFTNNIIYQHFFFAYSESCIHQGKVASETEQIGWVCPGMLSHDQSCQDLLLVSLVCLVVWANEK